MSRELLGKAELLREAQMQVRQRFSLLESGAEARLSVRALLRGGAEEFMRRMCAEVVVFIQKASAEEPEFRCRMMFHIQEVVVFIQKASVSEREGLVAEENRVAPEASDRQQSG